MDEDVKKLQEQLNQKIAENAENGSANNLAIRNKLDNSLSEYYDTSFAKNREKMQELTDDLVNAEMRVKKNQIIGQEKIMNSKTEQKVTEAKSDEDKAKHERAETILKAQGLTEKLPTVFRKTALIIGYPFFVLYLLTLGWVVEFLTLVVKGFITMIYDCANKFAELNKRFIENGNDKQFSLGKAIFNILKWGLIVGGVVTILILLISK